MNDIIEMVKKLPGKDDATVVPVAEPVVTTNDDDDDEIEYDEEEVSEDGIDTEEESDE